MIGNKQHPGSCRQESTVQVVCQAMELQLFTPGLQSAHVSTGLFDHHGFTLCRSDPLQADWLQRGPTMHYHPPLATVVLHRSVRCTMSSCLHPTIPHHLDPLPVVSGCLCSPEQQAYLRTPSMSHYYLQDTPSYHNCLRAAAYNDLQAPQAPWLCPYPSRQKEEHRGAPAAKGATATSTAAQKVARF